MSLIDVPAIAGRLARVNGVAARFIESPCYPNVKVLQEKQVITGSYRWLQVVEGRASALLRTS